MMIAFIIMGLAAPVFGQNSDDEARKYLVRGMAAIEMAKSETELVKAVAEFKKATEIAPNMAAVWYNLGSVQTKTGELKDAITSYRRYLTLAPQAEDARRINDEIIKLEYRLEQAESFKSLSGHWISESDGRPFKVEANGGKLTIKGRHSVESGAIDYCIDGKCREWPILYRFITGLDQRGGKWTGFWDVPENSFPTACSIPAGKAEVEGTLDEAKGRMVLKISRPKYRAVIEDEGPWSAKFRCAEVSVSGTFVEEKVLRGPLPAGSIRWLCGPDKFEVYNVDKGSAEEAAGLIKGDEIISIDGMNLASMKSDAERIMKMRGQPGSTAQLVVKRTTKSGGLFASPKEESIHTTVRRTDVSSWDSSQTIGACSGW
jgi:hypothetical protein